MAQNLKTFVGYLTGGWYVFSAPELAYANIISLKRSGHREYPMETYPTGSDANFFHNVSRGEIWFSPDRPAIDGNPDDRIFDSPEPIHIIYTGGDGLLTDTPPITEP